MSIPTRLRYVCRSQSRACARAAARNGPLGSCSHGAAPAFGRASSASRAFTLIELLVVVAIIALLLSILLPSLRSARDQAKAVACGAQMKGYTSSLATYTSEFRGWVPGVNTSGVELRALEIVGTADPTAWYHSDLPVQQFDWLTPLLRTSTSLPNESRAARFKFLLDEHRCPANTVKSIPLNFGNDADQEDFDELGPTTSTSYLMPVAFQHWGDGMSDRVLGRRVGSSLFGQLKAIVAPEIYQVRAPDGYVSRMSRIGGPAGKVFIADGTRLIAQDGTVNHDVDPYPTHFGAFTTSGGWFRGSQAYGIASETPNWDGQTGYPNQPFSPGPNLGLSYRHGSRTRPQGPQNNRGTVNVAFYDGHVERMGDRASRKIDMWYPRKSVVEDEMQGLTAVPELYEVR